MNLPISYCHSYSDGLLHSHSIQDTPSIPLPSIHFCFSVDIRIQQRSGRKTLTTVQGMPKTLDPKRALKAFKKEFACNGCIVDDPELGEVIQLSGDQRSKIAAVLISENICTKDQIKIHGF